MTDSNIGVGVAGGPVRHVPVMLNEVLDCLSPSATTTIIDGTFGAGGYSRKLLEAGARVVAIDRDPDAVRDGQKIVEEFKGRLRLVAGEFAMLDKIAHGCDVTKADGVVLDIGVSSMQLDEAERGFSFRHDGPLDMRMAQEGVSAADVVNRADQSDLTRIIGILGEERKASIISRAIIKARQMALINTTGELSAVIETVIARKSRDKIHPATRTFQALRIFINRELEQLCQALFAAERVLKEGGRLVVVTFHSLEDRIVKQFLRDRTGVQMGSRHLPEVVGNDPTFKLKGNGLIKPGELEVTANPRARSAKLRFGIRTAVKAPAEDYSIFGLPKLVDPSSFLRPEAG